MRPIGTMDEVRGKLALRGWRSLAAWAVANGYLPGTVRRAVYDWGHRADREPHGGINRQIIRDLRRELGEESGDGH